MINFSWKVVNKNIKQNRSKSWACGTPNNTEKGKENFPDIWMKEELFDK
jgi:hypothetical protein